MYDKREIVLTYRQPIELEIKPVSGGEKAVREYLESLKDQLPWPDFKIHSIGMASGVGSHWVRIIPILHRSKNEEIE
jgi:hypothetical protein